MVGSLLALVGLAVFAAWLGSKEIQKYRAVGENKGAPKVLSKGVLYEAMPGDPAMVTARSPSSEDLLWTTTLGATAEPPLLFIDGEVIEVRIAGTTWMRLNRDTGKEVTE